MIILIISLQNEANAVKDGIHFIDMRILHTVFYNGEYIYNSEILILFSMGYFNNVKVWEAITLLFLTQSGQNLVYS